MELRAYTVLGMLLATCIAAAYVVELIIIGFRENHSEDDDSI